MTAIVTKLKISPDQLRECVIESLAEVRCCTPQEVRDQLVEDGAELIMTSKETVAVASKVERRLDNHIKFSPLDFGTSETTGAATGKVCKISPNGCMDPAEDTDFGRFLEIAQCKINHISY